MLQSSDRFLNTGPMFGRHPPHHKVQAFKVLEPFSAAAVEALMDSLIDETLKRLDAFPDRQIDRNARIGIGPRARRIAALVDVAPHESGRALGETVHHR